METFTYERCDEIKQRIKTATEKWGCKVWVQQSNYDFTVNILVQRPDGAKSAWRAGLLNHLSIEGGGEEWEPVLADVAPAIQAAIEYASPV